MINEKFKNEWLDYLKKEGKCNNIIAKALTEYYLEDIDFDALQNNIINERDVYTFNVFVKKRKIETML
jgi:hypothetical protein